VDRFTSAAVLAEVTRVLAASQFETQVMVARGLDAGGEKASAPQRMRVGVLRDTGAIEKALRQDIYRALPSVARRLAPYAQRIANVRVSVLKLEPGSNLRLDLASTPSRANDIMLVTALAARTAGDVSLRMVRGPLRLGGIDASYGQLVAPLPSGRAVAAPALRPMEVAVAKRRGAKAAYVAVIVAQLAVK
jgi:hypothetical protein